MFRRVAIGVSLLLFLVSLALAEDLKQREPSTTADPDAPKGRYAPELARPGVGELPQVRSRPTPVRLPTVPAPTVPMTPKPTVSRSHPVPMGSMAYLDYKYGFRDVVFGSPLSAFRGMTESMSIDDLRWKAKYEVKGGKYRRAGDNLHLGKSCRLDKITYFFGEGNTLQGVKRWEGIGLAGVSLETLGASNAYFLLKELKTLYGKPKICGTLFSRFSCLWPSGHRAGVSFTIQPDEIHAGAMIGAYNPVEP